MDNVLEQKKLDVVEKNRSNIFNWRGQFTPQLVDYLLDIFASPESFVIDPFCGSGTVLLESALKNLSTAGCEINPAAYAMTKFISLVNLPVTERVNLFENVMTEIHRLGPSYDQLQIFEQTDDFRQKYKNLLSFAKELFGSMHQKKALLLALIVLMRGESNGRGNLSAAINKACLSVRNELLSLPFSENPIYVYLCDARQVHEKFRSSVDLIVTSPPYINVFNYHQNYRALLEVIGFDMLKVAESEIGSNRKNRMNRFRTVVQYALEMEQCLSSFRFALKPGGILLVVIGHESNVRGIPFYNSSILLDVAISLGCFQLEGEKHRTFLNRFGKFIREDIIIMRNLDKQPSAGSAYQIAEKYLLKAYQTSKDEPRDDIKETLNNLSSILPSPIFNKNGII